MLILGKPDLYKLVAKLLLAVWLLTSSHFSYTVEIFLPPLVIDFITRSFKPTSLHTSFKLSLNFWLLILAGSTPLYLFHIERNTGCRGIVTNSFVFCCCIVRKLSLIFSCLIRVKSEKRNPVQQPIRNRSRVLSSRGDWEKSYFASKSSSFSDSEIA